MNFLLTPPPETNTQPRIEEHRIWYQFENKNCDDADIFELKKKVNKIVLDVLEIIEPSTEFLKILLVEQTKTYLKAVNELFPNCEVEAVERVIDNTSYAELTINNDLEYEQSFPKFLSLLDLTKGSTRQILFSRVSNIEKNKELKEAIKWLDVNLLLDKNSKLRHIAQEYTFETFYSNENTDFLSEILKNSYNDEFSEDMLVTMTMAGNLRKEQIGDSLHLYRTTVLNKDIINIEVKSLFL